ncbi:PhzF family phenazine biosynthesis protein [Nocardiopsis sp. CC223A]|uniref:PhzF family phenazine biosynthesis protein n=1 Tax=Nocardiopsis sp. CC223A TaxID=3044051 RepID=UPI00278BE3E9|nr:PhzF family phenazine biosynthesis protein [Nocardiopsis sp. CC223A]
MPEYRVIDAFTDRPLAGNPAAVLVLDDVYDDAWAQGVAAEFNLSETAFVRPVDDPGADYELRWFTPTVEIDLCGHATLATAHALVELGVPGPYRFTTRSGVLTVAERDGRLWMDFPAKPPVPVPAPDGLAGALGAEPLWVGLGGADDLLVEVADEATVRGLAPDIAALGRLPYHLVIVTARAQEGREGADFVSRVFGPRVGVPEDPVTGRAHTVLAPFWAERLGRKELSAHQASVRGGDLLLEWRGDRVIIGGHAVSVARGELNL